MLFRFSWVVVFYVKVCNCCSLKIFYAQAKLVRNGRYCFDKRALSYSNMWVETVQYSCPLLLKLIYRNKADQAAFTDCFHKSTNLLPKESLPAFINVLYWNWNPGNFPWKHFRDVFPPLLDSCFKFSTRFSFFGHTFQHLSTSTFKHDGKSVNYVFSQMIDKRNFDVCYQK